MPDSVVTIGLMPAGMPSTVPAMAAFRQTRPVLDIGLFSDNPAMPKFYAGELGLPFFEGIQHSPTYEERFYELNGGWLKINYSDEPMAPGISGYRELVIAKDGLDEPRAVTDPDGLAVRLVPRGTEGVTHLGVRCAVADVEVQRRFLVDALGAIEDDHGLLIGDTRITLEHDPSGQRPTPTWRRGFNYVLVAVDDGPAAHQALVDAGAEHSLRPIRLGDRCIFSWVRDPNGLWIELVHYAEDGKPLPDIPGVEGLWEEVTAWREDGTPF
jgi:hypothetical protein